MMEDAELLRRYAVERSEAAFTELVRRNVDLVYSAALRLVNGDAHRAQDVTQQAFAEFARQANRLMGHPAPLAWLYTTTRLAALRTIRAEQRRTAREQEATTMNELLREPTREPDWDRVRPVLEHAMHELGEKDRYAVLLRFFQNKSLKEVGVALGLGENAARMRVDRALEKLRAKLVRRGITTTAAVLSAAISVNAVQVAPAGLAATLSGASLAGAAIGTGTTLTLLRFMATTKLKAGVISAIVVASVVTPLVIQRQAHAKLSDQNEALRRQTDQLAKMQGETERLSNLLARAGSQRLPRGQLNEVLRLRGEIGRLQTTVRELTGSKTNEPLSREEALASMRQMYRDRVNRLKELFKANPAQAVPEIQYLTDRDWLALVAYDHHLIDPDNSHAMSSVRGSAQMTFATPILWDALRQYGKDNSGQFPTDLSQLASYFKSPVDDSVLQNWTILRTSSLPTAMRVDADWVITQKAPINPELDTRFVVGLKIVHLGKGTTAWGPVP
jgi:RNA polymerase sigma factor (sigma-70 family)